MMKSLASALLLVAAASASSPPAVSPAPRLLDQFATGFMLEDGKQRAAAPECKDGLGWVYYNGHCYMFTSYQAESDFIKSVLTAVNPKDGKDYWIGGMDIDRDKGLQWLTGQPMAFTDFKNKDEPAGQPFLHMNFDAQFKWDTKDDANDKDNGFICKRAL